jgi:hypothetical protein
MGHLAQQGLCIRLIGRGMTRQKIDPTLTRYINNTVAAILNLVLVIAILGFFGVQTTSLAALIATAGVAIGMAWSGLLVERRRTAFSSRMSTTCLLTRDILYPRLDALSLYSGKVHALLLRAVALTLFLAPSITAADRPIEFSADMVITQTTGQTLVEKLYVGKGRARLDRLGQPGENNRASSLLMDFDHQLLYLLLPQAKMYLKIMGSNGIYFYRGSYLFRPQTPDTACSDWIPEADSRGVTLHCKEVGQETLDGRPTRRWDATATNGAHGSLWYDSELNFVVKVLRVSKEGVQSGYELQKITVAAQPSELFDVPIEYHEFTFNKLFDLLTKLGQW